ncbi:DNA cytosine methyltransferase [Saccharospirillum salsuginis]|uniref:DNA (cytosine-5-)-methyltransferase n=1 Tax=Saccharospirillum salsuginis TaxID=418750 RepID=A0A918KBB8_9GAMM|nr:DNA cytosine methyltransferase [Saccharospirillum salsuginis]GGX57410.1 cytosine-specific methyltransferase [Saccharospirillum salsuginis]
MKHQIIDLCSGCGGFSLGAEKAGFQVKISVDVDKTLHSSFNLNFPSANTLNADIGSFTKARWNSITNGERPTGVIGGPPCQGFSRIGKREIGDPRNAVVGMFFKNINILKPKFFVMENVEGILDERNRKILFDSIESVSKKYIIVGPLVVNARDYGAATNRKRVIVIGIDPNEMDLINENEIINTSTLKYCSVSDAISDLPSPTFSNETINNFRWSKYHRNYTALSKYVKKINLLPNTSLGWDFALSQISNGYISGNSATKHTKEVVQRFKYVAPGKSDTVSRFPRLEWNGQCPALRAGTGKEKGSFQSMRPIHPSEPRVITVREAARLQGFPDWFVFHNTIWHSFRMIGNSVSPLMAENILRIIYKKLSIN